MVILSLCFPAFSLFPDVGLLYRTLLFSRRNRKKSPLPLLSGGLSLGHKGRLKLNLLSSGQRYAKALPSCVSVNLDTSRSVERWMVPQYLTETRLGTI